MSHSVAMQEYKRISCKNDSILEVAGGNILMILINIMLGRFIPYYFYVIYRYVISEWRSIRPVEINQYDITMATHYDIRMGNDVARDIHCDITMSNDIAMCTYHGMIMNIDVAMNIFYYVFSALCLIVFNLFLYG